MYFVSGRTAGSFSVRGPSLHGKEAVAVTENSLRIKRTHVIFNGYNVTLILKLHIAFTLALG